MASSSAQLFLLAVHSESSTLPEHHDALAVMDSLDRLWFHGNVCRLPCFLLPSSSSCLLPISNPPPFQTIELVTPPLRGHASFGTRASEPQLPRARFESILCRPAVGKKRESSFQRSAVHLPSKPSGNVASKHRLQDTTGRNFKERLAAYPHGPPKFLEYKGTHRCHVPNLESISGKQLRVRAVDMNLSQERQEKRDWRRSSKNIMAFDFDELRGIKDLGFSFNKDDLTPRVVSVFPGLRWLLQETVGIKDVSDMAPMNHEHFPSSAWWIRKQDALMINWQMPEEVVDMKEHLKFWAHAVASVVRQ